MKKVLILGGGFAGVEAAIHLCKKGFNVTLVSNRDYIFVYPVSIWIPVRKREFGDLSIKLNDLKKKHGFDVIVDGVRNPSNTGIYSGFNVEIFMNDYSNYENNNFASITIDGDFVSGELNFYLINVNP